MAKYQIKPGSVGVCQWEIDPEWIEDGWYGRLQFLVGVEVETADGSFLRLFHHNDFVNDEEGAQRLASRVERRGEIDSKWWGHHGYLSLSQEERQQYNIEAERRELEDEMLGQYNDWMCGYRSVVGA